MGSQCGRIQQRDEHNEMGNYRMRSIDCFRSSYLHLLCALFCTRAVIGLYCGQRVVRLSYVNIRIHLYWHAWSCPELSQATANKVGTRGLLTPPALHCAVNHCRIAAGSIHEIDSLPCSLSSRCLAAFRSSCFFPLPYCLIFPRAAAA